jgi:Na+/melibiose symporter-like transporter
MGLTPRGRAPAPSRKAGRQKDGKLPVNPSGGLKAKGHPIGATGVSMHVLSAMQLVGEAPEGMQVKNPQSSAASSTWAAPRSPTTSPCSSGSRRAAARSATGRKRVRQDLRAWSRGFASILRLRPLWLLAPITLIGYAIVATARGLWIAPFMGDVHGFDAITAGNAATAMALAMVGGAFLYGGLEKAVGRVKPLVLWGTVATAIWPSPCWR